MFLMTDEDLVQATDLRAVVDVIRKALADSVSERLQAPPRLVAPLLDERLVFTAGGSPDLIGFRAYGQPSMEDEVVVVWDRHSGKIEAVIVGEMLGPMRTGAIGAVAADVLARKDSTTAAVVGSGRQARSQLAAVAAVRALTSVRVTSPTPEHRETYAAWVRSELGIEAQAIADVKSAVEGADLVLCATRADGPVLDPSWITPGMHVTTLGPCETGRSELPPDLVEAADIVATDAPAQVAAIGEQHFLYGQPVWNRILSLGELVGQPAPVRADGDVTVFLSIGLAGTEVALARWFAQRIAVRLRQ